MSHTIQAKMARKWNKGIRRDRKTTNKQTNRQKEDREDTEETDRQTDRPKISLKRDRKVKYFQCKCIWFILKFKMNNFTLFENKRWLFSNYQRQNVC
jgi:hypothetical protein